MGQQQNQHETEMKKYRLNNHDCATCAANIESRLRGVEGVHYVSVDFAAATLRIEADDDERAIREIKKVEPAVEVLAGSDTRRANPSEGGFDARRELARIAAAAVAFVLGVIFRPQLYDTPHAIAEFLVFGAAYLLSGWEVLATAARNIYRGRVFDENFLMTVATLGAVAIHELPEAVGVMLFFKVGEFFQDMAVHRSRRSIQALLEVRPNYANVMTNGQTRQVPPEEVHVGDTVVIKPGEKIPLDGTVVAGSSQVDTSALTGESVPRLVGVGAPVLAGMISTTGSLTIEVTQEFGASSISKILDLVENATSRKADTEKFITKFARYYTPIMMSIALAVALLPPILLPGARFSDWVYRALILLVVSCPCALVISIPLGYFGGIGGASRRGILVKGSDFLDALAALKTVAFDKTGTLTKGVFKVTQIVPANGFTESAVLRLAAEAEAGSNHPIARSILEAYGRKPALALASTVEEIGGFGIKAQIGNQEVIVGSDRLLHDTNTEHEVCEVGGTVAHVAVDGTYAGYIIISDEIKEDVPQAIRELKSLGVEDIVMLTGDCEAVAEAVAQTIGVDDYRAGLLPEDKVDAVEALLAEARDGAKVGFVGDGVNDAPVIARADVGIAMGALGSDAAIEAADVVIMTDAPAKVAEAIRVGRKTRRIVWQNIGLALTVKGAFVVLGIAGLATMWEAVFADVGVALIAVFNATRALR